MNKLFSQLKQVFPYTLPVLTGYLVLGAAYGILMDSKGFPLIYVILSSIFIYAGAMQFVSVAILASGFHPLYAVFLTLMVNARHLFYGLSMLTIFKGTGKYKPYLIFGLTDETFSLLSSLKIPEGRDKKKMMFHITLLNHMYWIIGSILGCILNSILNFNTMGIDFVLTALFIVIFIEKWKEARQPLPFIIGIAATVICRILFGASNFILPSMAAILFFVTVFKHKLGGSLDES